MPSNNPEDKTDYDTLLYPEIDDRLGIGVIAASVIFFVIVNSVIARLCHYFATQKVTSEWRFRNLVVSWIHATLCAMGVVYCYVHYIDHISSLSGLVDMRPYAAYTLTAFSLGYFLYDFADHIAEGQARRLWEVSLHHIANRPWPMLSAVAHVLGVKGLIECVVIFGYNLVFRLAVAFSVLSLMMEVNSVFLHGRKLLQMLKVPFNHWLYRSVVTLNLVTFVFFRGAAIGMILVGLRHNFYRLSIVYSTTLGLAVLYTVVLNPVLFWRLVKSDVLRELRPKRRSGDHVTKTEHVTKNDHVTRPEENGPAEMDGSSKRAVINSSHMDTNQNKMKRL